MQKLLFQNKYARAAMVINIGMLFSCIAPLVLVPLLVWFVVVIPQWCHTFNYVLVPPQGPNFDSGGIFWPVAVRMQIIALAVSQFILASILIIMEIVAGSVLVAILFIATLVRGFSLERYYARQAKLLPLEKTALLERKSRVPPDLAALVDSFAPALRYATRSFVTLKDGAKPAE